jgi:hypothetical protein
MVSAEVERLGDCYPWWVRSATCLPTHVTEDLGPGPSRHDGVTTEDPSGIAGPSPTERGRVAFEPVSSAAHHDHEGPHGTSLLPRDLTDDELAAAPVLASLDALLIDELTVEEDDAFAAALSS